MITNEKGFIPHVYQMRAVRILLGWDDLAACKAASITPDELALVERLPQTGALYDCAASRRAFAMIKYCGAVIASGAILRQHVDGDTLYFDAFRHEKPQDDFQIENFLPSSLQVRAALYVANWSDGDLRCIGVQPADLREYSGMSRPAYLRARRYGEQWPDIGLATVCLFERAANKAGIYFIDPARSGLPGWGLRFREVMARD